jgi:tRNA U34 5-methylaminomethyl-2-thiouridine-forming methyltransferase MnmC
MIASDDTSLRYQRFTERVVDTLETADGSLTLIHKPLQISYRSKAGAVTESRHVFLHGSGLCSQREVWSVLELGFGGGLNFLLTADQFLSTNEVKLLDYRAVERSPIHPSLFDELQYSTWLNNSSDQLLDLARRAFEQAHQRPNQYIDIRQDFGDQKLRLTLFAGDWQACEFEAFQAKAVYHDPFAPAVNPDAWSAECFRWSSSYMATDARLATYSSAGAVRRAMTDADLLWQKIPGPPHKREITIAFRKNA